MPDRTSRAQAARHPPSNHALACAKQRPFAAVRLALPRKRP